MDTRSDTKLLLSLIIPIRKTYDRLTSLLETFGAVLPADLEVIVVRDHDDPPPADFTTSPAVKVVVTDTTGLGPARNFGMRQAQGQFIAFCDGDDVLDLPVLMALTRQMRDTSSDMALSAYRKLHDDGRITDHDPSGGLAAGIVTDFEDRAGMSRGFYFCWNKVYRRAFVTAKGLTFPTGEYEDVYWSVLAIAQANQILVSQTPFYGYRQIENSAVNRGGSQHRDILDQYTAVLAQLRAANIPEPFVQGVWMQATRHILFVLCGTNRLDRADRRILFLQFMEHIRSGPGVGLFVRASNISVLNKVLIVLRSPLFLELRRLFVPQR